MIRFRHIATDVEYRITNNEVTLICLGESRFSIVSCENVIQGVIDGRYNLIKTAITKYPEEDA